MMKKLNKIFLLTSVLMFVGYTSFADGNAFTPLDFGDTNYNTSQRATQTVSPATPKNNSVDLSAGEIPIGNDNIQNAILELDNAQTGIRADLLNYKAKYADVDAQYKLIKNERTMLSKQVKSIEKRIKSIDRAKEKIRKNML